jgi:hypothetical protein
MAAASLKAPGSPWKATRRVVRSIAVISTGYLAISAAKQEGEIVRD